MQRQHESLTAIEREALEAQARSAERRAARREPYVLDLLTRTVIVFGLLGSVLIVLWTAYAIARLVH